MADRIEAVRKYAAKAFAEHQITERQEHGLFRSYRCQKPGSWAHGFVLTTTPGWLMVHGDIDFMAWSREPDMIAWFEKSKDDPCYLAGKVPSTIKTMEFDESLIQARVIEWRRQGRIDADQAREIYEASDEHSFWDAIVGTSLVDDPPTMTNYTHGFLWAVEAVRWFLANKGKGE